MKKYIQVKLKQEGNVLTTWLHITPSLKESSRIKLKEYEGWWIIEKTYPLIELTEKELLEKEKINKSFGLSIK